MSHRLLLSVLLSCGLSCDNDRLDDDLREATLISSQHPATDTLEIHLIRRLQHLLEAAATADSASIADLVTADFTAVDTRVSRTRTSGEYAPGEKLTYWQVVAGRLSGRLDHEYSSFSVEPTGDAARVFAVGTTHDIWTTWSYREDAWRAETILLIRRVDSESSIVGNRSGPRSR